MRSAALALLVIVIVSYLALLPYCSASDSHYYVYEYVIETYENGKLVIHDTARLKFEEINSTAFRVSAMYLNKSGTLYAQLFGFLKVLNETGGVIKVYKGLLTGPFPQAHYIAPKGLQDAVPVAEIIEDLIPKECERLECVRKCMWSPHSNPQEYQECAKSCGESLANKTKEIGDPIIYLDAALHDMVLAYLLVFLQNYCDDNADIALSARQENGLFVFTLIMNEESTNSVGKWAVSSVYSQNGWLINATIKREARSKNDEEPWKRITITKIYLVDTNDEAVKSAAETASSIIIGGSEAVVPTSPGTNAIVFTLAIIGVAAVVAVVLWRSLSH